MATDNRPGALHRCLGVFAEAGLNMSRLESRPSRGRAWEYVFWIDLDADARDPTVAAELDRLGEAASMVRVMGSYPRADESAAPGPPAAVPQASEERMF